MLQMITDVSHPIGMEATYGELRALELRRSSRQGRAEISMYECESDGDIEAEEGDMSEESEIDGETLAYQIPPGYDKEDVDTSSDSDFESESSEESDRD